MAQLTLVDRVYQLQRIIGDIDEELRQLGDDYRAGYISETYALATIEEAREAMTS